MTAQIRDIDMASVRYAPGSLNGYRLSYTTTTTVGVAAGAARDSSDTVNIVDASTDTIDFGTTGAGGLDTGSLAANTHYACYKIMKEDGTVSVVASLQFTGGPATPPSGYIYYRYIGGVLTDTSAATIRNFNRTGNREIEIVYDIDAADALAVSAGAAGSYTQVDLSPWLPPTAHVALCIQNLGSTVDTTFRYRTNGFSEDGSFGFSTTVRFTVHTDSSQLIEYQRTAGAGGVFLRCHGYKETL